MKFIKCSFYVLTASLLLSSCKKQLELVPTDTFTPANAFRSISDAQLGANEAYGRFGTYANTMYQSALLSDEGKLGRDNSGQGALTYRYQFSSDATTGGDVINTFGGYYYVIDQINRVLAALPTVIAANSYEESRRNVLKGQMLALRAISHYQLLRAYSKNYNASDPKGIAYMTVSDPNAQPARLSVGATVALVEKDMDDAYSLLPAVTSSTFSDTVMNQVNVNAYRAKIALYKGEYQKAIDYTSSVINSGVKTLASGANYTGIWTDANTNELLFRIRLNTSTAVGGLFTTTGNLIYIAPSDKLIATYASTDIRKATFIGGMAGAYYVNKFYTSSRGGRAVDIKVSRISEMYLIRAEAYAKLSAPNITAGAADLNAVRLQRITGYTNATFASTADLITAVLDERFKELCFEGYRFFDLKRNNLPVQRLASDVTTSAWQTLAAGDYRFVLPIPQYEILANPSSTQNDGY